MNLTKTVMDVLEDKVLIDDGCWLWTGKTDGRAKGPYGQFTQKRNGVAKKNSPHRAMYELMVGPIPEGLTIDHLCNTPLCCRPDHLEPVTAAENQRRLWIRQRERQAS